MLCSFHHHDVRESLENWQAVDILVHIVKLRGFHSSSTLTGCFPSSCTPRASSLTGEGSAGIFFARLNKVVKYTAHLCRNA